MNNKTHNSDTDLAQRIKQSEKKAFQELFERYAPKLYHFSIKYLKNEADAEELVQDVFLKIWERRDMIDSSLNLEAYIFKIAVNTIYDLIRHKNVKNAFSEFIRKDYTDSVNSTWDSIIYGEVKTIIEKLTAQLPEQRRRVFQLSKIEGLTNDEIAKRLNISKRTVENQLYRAIAFLKQHLEYEHFYTLLFFSLFYC